MTILQKRLAVTVIIIMLSGVISPAIASCLVLAYWGTIAFRSTPKPPLEPPLVKESTHYTGDAIDDIEQAIQDYRAGKITRRDFDTAMDHAGRGIH